MPGELILGHAEFFRNGGEVQPVFHIRDAAGSVRFQFFRGNAREPGSDSPAGAPLKLKSVLVPLRVMWIKAANLAEPLLESHSVYSCADELIK